MPDTFWNCLGACWGKTWINWTCLRLSPRWGETRCWPFASLPNFGIKASNFHPPVSWANFPLKLWPKNCYSRKYSRSGWKAHPWKGKCHWRPCNDVFGTWSCCILITTINLWCWFPISLEMWFWTATSWRNAWWVWQNIMICCGQAAWMQESCLDLSQETHWVVVCRSPLMVEMWIWSNHIYWMILNRMSFYLEFAKPKAKKNMGWKLHFAFHSHKL